MANEINVQLGEPHIPRIGLERIMYSPTTIIYDPNPATTEEAGIVELATNAETLAGTDTERAVTPSGLHSTKGAAGGIAELDSNGKVPSSQLPSFVDDVVEAYYKTADDRFYEESSFTTLITPSAGKSWVDIPTNKSYRWTGSVYVRVDEGVQLGETSDTAYRGDRGKVAYDHATDANRNTTSKSKKIYKMSLTAQGHVGSDADEAVWFGTQAEYDALPSHDPDVIYHIKTKNIPEPTVADAGKLLSVDNSGNYELVTILNAENIPY